MHLELHQLVGSFYLKESYMNNRHVDTLVRTEFLDDNDFLITEESELLRKVSVSDIEKFLSYSSPINFSPRS